MSVRAEAHTYSWILTIGLRHRGERVLKQVSIGEQEIGRKREKEEEI